MKKPAMFKSSLPQFTTAIVLLQLVVTTVAVASQGAYDSLTTVVVPIGRHVFLRPEMIRSSHVTSSNTSSSCRVVADNADDVVNILRVGRVEPQVFLLLSHFVTPQFESRSISHTFFLTFKGKFCQKVRLFCQSFSTFCCLDSCSAPILFVATPN